MKEQSKKLKDKDRDLWYKRMGERKTIHPENEPMVGLMEFVDMMDYYNKDEE